MKMKIFSTLLTILLIGAASVTWAADASDKMVTVDPATAQYVTPPGLPTCATLTPLKGDPSKGAFLVLAKISSGCAIPWHWHTYSENLMMVSGTGLVEMKDGGSYPFQAGGYVSLPAHHVHQATCTKDCVTFLSSDGAFDIHYVNKAGKEIPMDKALKKNK